MNNEFLKHIAHHLTKKLPGQVRHGKIQVYPGKNSVRLYFAELDSSYYEAYLNGAGAEIGFRFAGGKIKNRSRFSLFEMHLYSLQQKFDRPLIARLWQTDGAQVILSLPAAMPTVPCAQKYADILLNFIDLTHPTLCSVFEAIPAGSKQVVDPPPLNHHHYGAYLILSRRVDQVQAFLRGQSGRPTDDVLCDWVQFCYTFEFFKEGAELFNLIDQHAVQPWLYDRAQRLAKVCRLRAK